MKFPHDKTLNSLNLLFVYLFKRVIHSPGQELRVKRLKSTMFLATFYREGVCGSGPMKFSSQWAKTPNALRVKSSILPRLHTFISRFLLLSAFRALNANVLGCVGEKKCLFLSSLCGSAATSQLGHVEYALRLGGRVWLELSKGGARSTING